MDPFPKLWDKEISAQSLFPRESQKCINRAKNRFCDKNCVCLGFWLALQALHYRWPLIARFLPSLNRWSPGESSDSWPMMFLPPYKRAKLPRVRRGSWPRLIWSNRGEVFHIQIWSHTSQLALKHIFPWQETYETGTHQDVLPHIDNADKRSSKKIGCCDHSGVIKAAHQAKSVELCIMSLFRVNRPT